VLFAAAELLVWLVLRPRRYTSEYRLEIAVLKVWVILVKISRKKGRQILSSRVNIIFITDT